jgi:hypothetical protein
MKLGLAALFLLAGCGAAFTTEDDVARTRAANDLGCPAAQISLHNASDGSTIAAGCGMWTQYWCFSRAPPICLRDGPAQVNRLPAR